MALFQPTIDTGTQQSVRPAGGEQPSAIVAMAPAISQGISQISSFFADKNKAEAEAGKKKVLGTVAKKLLELQGQTGKVSATALRATRTKFLSDIIGQNEGMTDDIMSTVNSMSGVTKELNEGTPKEKAIQKAYDNNVTEAGKSNFYGPNATSEQVEDGTARFMVIKEASEKAVIVAADKELNKEQKEESTQIELRKASTAASSDFRENTIVNVLAGFESGAYESPIKAERELDLELEKRVQALKGIGGILDEKEVTRATAGLVDSHANAVKVIRGEVEAGALANMTKISIEKERLGILEDPLTRKAAALQTITKGNDVVSLKLQSAVVTKHAGEMLDSDDPLNVGTKDPAKKKALQSIYDNTIKTIDLMNKGDKRYTDDDFENVEKVIVKVYNGIASSSINDPRPEDLQTLAKFMANKSYGKYVANVGVPDQLMFLVEETLQDKYMEPIMNGVRKEVFEKQISTGATGAFPVTAFGSTGGLTAPRTGAGAQTFSFFDNVEFVNKAGTIRVEARPTGDLTTDSLGALKREVSKFNSGKLSALINQQVLIGAHLESRTDYGKYVEENMTTILGVSEDPSKKEAREYVESVKQGRGGKPEDQVAIYNAEAKRDGIDLSVDGDFELTDGTIISVEGGQVVRVL